MITNGNSAIDFNEKQDQTLNSRRRYAEIKVREIEKGNKKVLFLLFSSLLDSGTQKIQDAADSVLELLLQGVEQRQALPPGYASLEGQFMSVKYSQRMEESPAPGMGELSARMVLYCTVMPQQNQERENSNY